MAKKSGFRIVLRPIRRSAAVEAKYERRLKRLINTMQASVKWWIRAEYKKQESAITMDAAPWARLKSVLDWLSNKWVKFFDTEAKKIAEAFAKASDRHSKAAIAAAMRDSNALDFMTVNFKYRSAQEQDMLWAITARNINLIKTIPAKYFADLSDHVIQSIESGRDLAYLTKEIDKLGQVSHKRAKMIAKDQNEKAMAALNRIRFLNMGVKKAIWTHTPAGKTWRHTHSTVMDGKEFDLREGLYDPDPRVKRKIQPGELVNCHCVCRMVFEPGKRK